jgi:hypothetical protein
VVVLLLLSRFSKFHFGSQTQGALKADLRAWNEEEFGNVGRKKQVLLEELWVLEREHFALTCKLLDSLVPLFSKNP